MREGKIREAPCKVESKRAHAQIDGWKFEDLSVSCSIPGWINEQKLGNLLKGS